MIKMTGRCHCGGVRYVYDGAVQRFAYCHCDDCRQISGSPFSAAVVLEAAGFRITQGESLLTGYASSPGKIRSFCKQCGTPICARMEARPGIVIVRAGTIEQPPVEVAPQMHIWVNAKAPWHTIDDKLPQYAEGYIKR